MLNSSVCFRARRGISFVAFALAIGGCADRGDAPQLLKTFPVPADAQNVQRNNAKGITGRMEESVGFAIQRPPRNMDIPLALERVSRDQGWTECKDKLPTGWGEFIDRSSKGEEKNKLQFRRLYKKGDWLAELLMEQAIADKKSQPTPSTQLVHLRIGNRDANSCQ